MMAQTEMTLPDTLATTRLGQCLQPLLVAGDCVALNGGMGAGKSHLARAIIQHAQAAHGPVEDVPSPTYTLIQTYRAGKLEILHADLYRLGDSGELDELGLFDAFGTTLCLIEWPDKLGDRMPDRVLSLDIENLANGRRARLRGDGWAARFAQLDAAWNG